MKYILLMYAEEGAWPPDEHQAALQESIDICHQLHAKGKYLDASPLLPPSTASCVRVREGKSLVTDGPYAETKEQLGGYFLIEAASHQEAISIASGIPGARRGTAEVRPLMEVAGLPVHTSDSDSSSLTSTEKTRSRVKSLIGWVLTGLISAFLILVSASGKFMDWEGKDEMFSKLGFTTSLMAKIGILEVVLALLLVIPRTGFLAAILLTAYLGGATVTHVRVGDPFFFPILLGLAMWIGYGLRRPEVFRLL